MIQFGTASSHVCQALSVFTVELQETTTNFYKTLQLCGRGVFRLQDENEEITCIYCCDRSVGHDLTDCSVDFTSDIIQIGAFQGKSHINSPCRLKLVLVLDKLKLEYCPKKVNYQWKELTTSNKADVTTPLENTEPLKLFI